MKTIFNNLSRILFARLMLLSVVLIASPLASAQGDELAVTYMKSGVDFKQYYQLLLTPLDLSNTRLVPPPWVENPDPRRWQLSENNQTFLRAAYMRAVKQGLEASGKFNVVTNPTPGTMQMDMRIISLQPYAARGEKVTTKGYGTLRFEAHLRDAQTGELLGVYEGEQQVGADYQENTDFNKASNLAQHFNNWGKNIASRLEAAHNRE